MTKNYFELFGFAEKIDIDLDILEEKYLEFQRNFHPDKAGIKEIEKSILINEGYDILKDDISRASHILKLNEIDIENDEKAPKVDFETLSEIMTIQEKIIDSDQNEKKQIEQELKTKIKELLQIVKNEINNKNFVSSAQNLMKLKYYSKALKDLKKKT